MPIIVLLKYSYMKIEMAISDKFSTCNSKSFLLEWQLKLRSVKKVFNK